MNGFVLVASSRAPRLRASSQREILHRLHFDASRHQGDSAGVRASQPRALVRDIDGARDALAGADDRARPRTWAPSRRTGARARSGAAIVYAATRRVTGRSRKSSPYRLEGARLPRRSAGRRAKQRPKGVRRSEPAGRGRHECVRMGTTAPTWRASFTCSPRVTRAYYQEVVAPVARCSGDWSSHAAPGDVPLRRRICELGPRRACAGRSGRAARGPCSASSPLPSTPRRAGMTSSCATSATRPSRSAAAVVRHLPDIARDLDDDPRSSRRRTSSSGRRSPVWPGRGRGGTQAVAEMLNGKSTGRVVRFGFDGLRLRSFNKWKHDDVMRLLRALSHRLRRFSTGDFPTPVLTALGPGPCARGRHSHAGSSPERCAKKQASRFRDSAGARPGWESVLPRSVPPTDALRGASRAPRFGGRRKAGVPAYVVAHERHAGPRSRRAGPRPVRDLETIRGMGPVKIARYATLFGHRPATNGILMQNLRAVGYETRRETCFESFGRRSRRRKLRETIDA